MRAKLNGTEIYFDVGGTGLQATNGHFAEKPVIVALHGGLGYDHGYLRHGLGPLHDHAQVIYVDLRGQGRSGRPDLASCTLEQLANDVVALCDSLGIGRAFMLGHSAGGFVAMHTALRYPQLVAGLILCGSTPTMRALPYHFAPSHMHLFDRVLKASSFTIEMMQHFMSTIAPSYDLRPSLERITAPTLVMVGRYDWVCPPRASRAIARGIPGAQLVEFDNAGHMVFSEEPAQFLDAKNLHSFSMR
jgi:proline iminopeptidase